MSLHHKLSQSARQTVRIQRCINAVSAIAVAMVLLAGTFATLDLFATRPVPTYRPPFVLVLETVEPTCGGMICCPNPNYVPPKPIAPSVGHLVSAPPAPRWKNTMPDAEAPSVDFGDPQDYGAVW